MASPTFTFTRTLTRTTMRLRQSALPLTLGLTTGLVARRELLDAETVKELSGGSLAGFFAGLLVSVFSKTLVLLAGIAMLVIQAAARNGIDLVAYLKLKDRVKSSRVLAALNQHAAFKLSFALAFSLSAFMSF
ncbi:1047f1b0-af9d-4b11-a04a-92d9d6015c09 [Thermothielavioides terrestris]|uniref:1047f1b0-af9d-4b11-a04a-92d9d6015c09 n=1 Tax=Thermothielavioides terrestris TaxID=2587410 RepID=A0A3S4APC9_9PEZI|nr:1047f1b0-af9d-4b11-a04a-92d9d6015c09 [Thermothielavioides terrestris]